MVKKLAVTQPEALMDAAADAGSGALEVCLTDFGFPALTAEEFLHAGVEELNHSVIRACRAGTAFWAAQEALKNTECADGAPVSFKEWIAEKGLHKERVYECVRLAKCYGRLPPVQRAQVLKLGKKPALLLASLPPEVIEEAAESGHDVFAEAEVLTYAELKAKVKQFEAREKNYDAELERMKLKVNRLEKAREPLSPFLARTEDIRAECLWHQEEAEVNLNSLRKLFEDINIEPNAPEWRYQIEQVWLTANFVAAQAASLVHACREMCAVDDLPVAIESQHMMTAPEAARWLEDAEAVKSQYSGRKAARDLLRQKAQEAAGVKKRGRPANPQGAK